jgi:hypothetical protein
MNTNIAKALVAAQREFGPALKTNTNPHFRSKYADLSACVEAVIDALNSNNIMLMQNTHESDSGVIVETIFLHESGESISNGRLHVTAAKNDPQGYGSALTYARRYSLMAACGIAPEDDDGNAASKSKPQQQAQLPKLSDEESDKVHAKWHRFRATLVDSEGDLDHERIADEWGKLASNVRRAIKSIDDARNAAAQNDKEAQSHMESLKESTQ